MNNRGKRITTAVIIGGIVLICIRDLPALSSGSDPANSKDHDQESCQYSSA